MKFKFNPILLILVAGAVFLAYYGGLFAAIPFVGQQRTGSVDPLYTYSFNVAGFGSAQSSRYIQESIGDAVSINQASGGLAPGVTEDNGQLKFNVNKEVISATKSKITLTGTDLALFGKETIGYCFVYPDAIAARYGGAQQSSLPGLAVGYYFDKTLTLRQNTNGLTMDIYAFNTNDPEDYDVNKAPDLTFSNFNDFGWKKVKHLKSSDMIGPGSVVTLNSWGGSVGIQPGAIPNATEIATNFNSYPTLSAVQCGDVATFKKEYTITEDPNHPTGTYVTLAFDDNFNKTATVKQAYLVAPEAVSGSSDDLTKATSDLGKRTDKTGKRVNLSKLFYVHFGPCGENVPLRWKLITESAGTSCGSSYYSTSASFLSERGYFFNGSVYVDQTGTDTAGRLYHLPNQLKCPDGSFQCNLEKAGNGIALVKQNTASTVSPGGSQVLVDTTKEYLGKTDPNYNALVPLTYWSYAYVYFPPQNIYTQGITSLVQKTYNYTVDFSKVPYTPELKEMNGIITALSGKPEEIGILEGGSYSYGGGGRFNSCYLPDYVSAKNYEAPLIQPTKSSIYDTVYAQNNNTYIFMKPNASRTYGHGFLFFYKETPEYIKYKEIYKGTTCGFEIEVQENKTEQTIVPNEVLVGNQTIAEVNQERQTGDKQAYGGIGIPAGSTGTSLSDNKEAPFTWEDWIYIGIAVVVLIIVYVIFLRRKR